MLTHHWYVFISIETIIPLNNEFNSLFIRFDWFSCSGRQTHRFFKRVRSWYVCECADDLINNPTTTQVFWASPTDRVCVLGWFGAQMSFIVVELKIDSRAYVWPENNETSLLVWWMASWISHLLARHCWMCIQILIEWISHLSFFLSPTRLDGLFVVWNNNSAGCCALHL